MAQTPEKKPEKKPRSEKQIAWSRQLGQKSKELKAAKKAEKADQESRQENEQEKIIHSPTPKPSSSQLLVLPILGGLSLLAYFLYKKKPEKTMGLTPSKQTNEPPVITKKPTVAKHSLILMQ